MFGDFVVLRVRSLRGWFFCVVHDFPFFSLNFALNLLILGYSLNVFSMSGSKFKGSFKGFQKTPFLEHQKKIEKNMKVKIRASNGHRKYVQG